MGAITLRLTDEMRAFVEDEAKSNGYPSAEAFIQSLVMDDHGRKLARLHALLDDGLASGVSERSIEQVLEDAKQRYRARHA